MMTPLMTPFSNPIQWILGSLLILSALGVISVHKPVHACLSFLLTLLILACIYLQLSAQFIAVMQVLVYAGAILVIFMFVIVLFQDAHEKIYQQKAKSFSTLLFGAAAFFSLTVLSFGWHFIRSASSSMNLPKPLQEGFGSVQLLGKALYLDFFFPFEAVILLFLIAVIGALYLARKEKAMEEE